MTLRLRATLEPRGPAAAIVLTDEQVAVLGGENLLGPSRKLRADLGVQTGDAVDVVIAADAAPREVPVPPALAEALTEDPTATTAFEALAPSHRREFARWIAEAKRGETSKARAGQDPEMMREGRTRH